MNFGTLTNMRLERELHVRRALVTATGNAAEVFPREHQREGGTRLREAPGLDAALPRARHMFPQD